MYPSRDRPLQLPVGPFAEWLRSAFDLEGTTEREIERHLGFATGHLNQFLSGRSRTVHIDVVDRALTRDGRLHLRDLYPEIYEEAA